VRRPAPASNTPSTTLIRSARLGALLLALFCLLTVPAAPITELDAVGEHNIQIARRVLESGDGKIGAVYAACMNEEAALRAGRAPLRPLFARIDAIHDRTSLSTTLAELDNAGVNALWLATTQPDSHGSPHYIAVIAPSSKDDRYNLLSREQLDTLVPEIDWGAYFHARGFSEFADLNVTDADYLLSLSERLRRMQLPEMKRLLRERLIAAFSAWLPENAGGRASEIPRWKRCVALVDTEMPGALGRAWVERAFSPQAKAKAEEMVDAIMAAMRERLRGAAWLSDGARAEALAKLDGMTKAIGYPDRWDDLGGNVEIDSRSLIADIVHANTALVAARVAKLNAPLDRRSFAISVLAADAYYAPLRNEIVVPAGLLQPPLFGADDASNYGAAGAAIGHEIAHAFDESGHRFDAEGRLRDWWTPQDARAFASRAACVQQGTVQIDERVADATGMSVAFDAFKKTAADTGPDAERRFFDAFKAMWAGTDRGDAALANLRTCSTW
jgi:putative endopeptidase